jgi:hypothetical protein
LSPVVADFGVIMFGLVAVTVAPLTAAPFGSVTIPSIDPVVEDWPKALLLKSATDKATSESITNRLAFLMLLSSSFLNS